MNAEPFDDLAAWTARQVLSLAVAIGSRDWARVHGYQWNCSDDLVHAQGVDTCAGRALWRVDLDDISRAVQDVVEHSSRVVVSSPDYRRNLSAARRQLRQARASQGAAISPKTADIVLQIAALGQVRYS